MVPRAQSGRDRQRAAPRRCSWSLPSSLPVAVRLPIQQKYYQDYKLQDLTKLFEENGEAALRAGSARSSELASVLPLLRWHRSCAASAQGRTRLHCSKTARG